MKTTSERNQQISREFEPLTPDFNQIGKQIVDAAYTVHKRLGPGLLEKVYEVYFCYELEKRDLKYSRQVDIPIFYDGMTFNVINVGQGIRRFVL